MNLETLLIRIDMRWLMTYVVMLYHGFMSYASFTTNLKNFININSGVCAMQTSPASLNRLTYWLCLVCCLLFFSFKAQAVPSFARQTGYSCAQCHTQSFGPNLTPLGRDFKLNGYTEGEAENLIPGLSAMVEGSLTHTQKEVQQIDKAGYSTNNNFTFDQASLFYAGRLTKQVGVFSQLTYDGVADSVALDNTDVRFARNTDIGDYQVNYGISLNNNPTVQDLWNTTPAWGYPYNGSAVQPSIGAMPIIDGGFGPSQVGGGSFYTLIENMLYFEGGAYSSIGRSVQNGLGAFDPAQNEIDGAAPYWRFGIQKNWKGHYVQLGHYGMAAQVFPERDKSTGLTDSYTDYAVDANYQYMGNTKHIFEFKTAYIYEDQNLAAQRALGGWGTQGRTYLTSYKLNSTYTYDQTYGITFGYNRITGSQSTDLYGDGYTNNRPNSAYFTAELVYVPFGKSNSQLGSLLNLRTSLQYIGYSRFNGDTTHSQDNNTFLVNGWLAF